ncbi:MAG: hypothetical protein ABW252_14020 [Polyangiales bacterium]
MLEGLLGLATSIGLMRGLLARLAWAILGGTLLLYLLAADTLNVLASRFDDLHPVHLFIFMFLGVGTWHRRGHGPLPLPDLFVHDPILLKVARGVTAALVAWRYLRASSKLNPLVGRAYTLESVAMPFVAAAVIDGIELVLLMLGRALAERI